MTLPVGVVIATHNRADGLEDLEAVQSGGRFVTRDSGSGAVRSEKVP